MGGSSLRPVELCIQSSHCSSSTWKSSNLEYSEPLACSWHLGQLSQSCEKSDLRWSGSAMMTVVPESGMAPHGVSWPGSFELQKATGWVSSPTEMPRKSRPQWKVPMEPRAPGSAGVPRRRTPSALSLKHMENRPIPADSRKPLGRTPWSMCGWCLPCAGGAGGTNSRSCSSDLGRPRPRMPSNGPLMERAWSTMRSTESCMGVLTFPTRTRSVAMTASTCPLPKVSTIAGVSPLNEDGIRKVDERFVPL
mmetsp:Transcript_116487/g.340821  ORF Transcript_116487/g.340821 Transcript_116487/m.340821 type:complete len:250 (+) Transcript_116487:560-1309(+)